MVFGLFSKERALQRTIKKATNKLAQSADRWGAMEKLRDDGSEEALYGLLLRFSFASQKSVEDEQEKAWVVDTMTAMGERCLPALRRYMKSETAIAYALRILEGVADREKALAVVDEILGREEPGYTRDPGKRIQVIDWLAEWQGCSNAEVIQRVAPYLADFDEGVRFAAAAAIGVRPGAEATQALVTALIKPDEESRRLRVKIAEILADHQLDLGGATNEIAGLLETVLGDFRLQRDKLVRKSPG